MLQHVTREVQPSTLPECVRFYAILGFEPVPTPSGVDGRAVWLAPPGDRYGAQIHLLTNDDARPQLGHVAFVVPAYEATVARLREMQSRRPVIRAVRGLGLLLGVELENAAAAFPGFFEMGLGVAKRIASEYEIGRGNGNGGDAGFLESRGEETRAEALAKGSETIGEFGGRNDRGLERHFVEKIAAEKLETASDTVMLLFAELKILQHMEVVKDNALGFIASVGVLSFGKRTGDREQTIGDALHSGDHDNDAGIPGGCAHQTCGVQHALGSHQRAAAKL